MNILVVGYTYISYSQRATFNFYPHPENVFFLLPDIWRARRGKVIHQGPKGRNIFLTKAYFYHSHYPLIGGLLKGWMPNFPLVLLRLKWTRNIKLVYSCSEPALLTTLYNGFWSKIFGLKYVAFSWENIPYEKKYAGASRIFRKFFIRLTLFFCDGLICGTRKSAGINRPYMPRKPISIFPMNGLDPDFFKRQNGPKIFLDINLENKIVFSFVGMVDKRKGVHLIPGAFTAALEKLPSSHLIIAGSGKDDAVIQGQIERLNISGNVMRIPWVNHNELVKLLSVSDIFVYPSIPYEGWEEQFGYAIAEASLTGLPVISTRSGSIEEVVLDGKTGVLVPPDDVEALGDAMIYLGKDKKLREWLGQAGREFSIANFSHKVIAKKFHDFFKSLT